MFRPITIVALFWIVASDASAEILSEPVLGPKLICFKYSSFSLNDGERITEFSGSAESLSIRVESPSGDLGIGESEIFAPAKGTKRLVHSVGRTSVYFVRSRGRYALYGPTSFSDGKDRLVIWLSGKKLKGKKSDRSVYERFTIQDPAGLPCDQTFTYSWDFFAQ